MPFEDAAQPKKRPFWATQQMPALPSCTMALFLNTFEVAAVAGEHMTDGELCRLGAAGKTSFVYVLDLRFEDRIWRAVFPG